MTPPYKKRTNSKIPVKKPEEFRARSWLPRGIHVTVYDIQGNAISEQLTKEIQLEVERLVMKANIPTLAIDVKKG